VQKMPIILWYGLVVEQMAPEHGYMAPEQMAMKPRYSKSVDIYALEIIFLEMLTPDFQNAFNGKKWEKLTCMIDCLINERHIPSNVVQKWPGVSDVILKMTSKEGVQIQEVF